MKNKIRLLVYLTSVFAMSTVAFADEGGSEEASSAVTILYTNDVHTYINNVTKDEDGNEVKLLSYASVSALRQELEAAGENVLLVDAGDHSQGTAFGGMDEGKSIIQIMNKTGYRLATLGNHEFDYGMFRAFAIMDEADYPYVSCNFYSVEEEELVLPSYEILEAGDVKIAFIGISTPDTITGSVPSYFMDETGENYIYGFYGGEDGRELYEAVQTVIDEVKDEADYVIALGHLGVDPSSVPYTSREVIEHTTGLDAFIDGHSHTVLESEEVTDAEGNAVVLTQTGCYLGAIGEMTIEEDGTIETSLITEYNGIDEEVLELEKAWIDEVDEKLGEEIGTLETELYICNPEDTEERLVRRQETNLGDFVSDACYYYFNEVMDLPCDVVMTNGGGIRTGIEEGTVSYLTAKTVNPFGNVICMIKVSGQEILDALEKGAMTIGVVDEETGRLSDSHGFMQVSGLTYEINSGLESTVSVDENGIWTGAPTGEYKVSNVKVYDRESGEYLPLDLEKTYNLAGINHILRNQGSGMGMFKDNEVVIDYVNEDYLVLAEYMKAFTTGEDAASVIKTENSPLKQYEGYLIDYENPSGSGRIVMK